MRNQESTSGRKLQAGRVTRGFTLIEIMVVIAIIVILVGLTVAIGSGVRAAAERNQTKVTLQNLKGILDTYRTETGTIPPGRVGWGNPLTGGATLNLKNTPAINMFPCVAWNQVRVWYFPGDIVTTTITVTKDATSGAVQSGDALYLCLNQYYTQPAWSSSPSPYPQNDPSNWRQIDPTDPALAARFFIPAMMQLPATKGMIARLPAGVTRTRLFFKPSMDPNDMVPLISEVDDGFGNPIGYVPSGAPKAPFFVSAGPDGLLSGTRYEIAPYTDTAGDKAGNADNIHSFEP